MKSVLDYFLELVQIDSESRCEGRLAAYLQRELESLGAEVFRDTADSVSEGECGNIIARFQGSPTVEPLLLCAHMDTVKPGIRVKPVLENDLIRSGGNTILGADDKSGIAMILAAIDELRQDQEIAVPLDLLFTVSEEIGLLGAKGLDYSLLRASRGYVLDGNSLGEAVIAAPTQISWQAIMTGQSAHAGIEPEKGVNALKAAAAAITEMPDGRIDQHTTMNTGMIKGGKATNIVCSEVITKGEIRSHNPDKIREMAEIVKEIWEKTALEYKCRLNFEQEKVFSGYRLGLDHPLLQLSAKAFGSLGIDQKQVVNGGGSDANVFFEKNMQTLVIGPGMQKIHTTDEFILLSDLKKGKDWVKKIISLWEENNV